MKTYTIYASQVIYFKKEVQANSKEEADALAFEYSEDNYWELVDWLKLHSPLTLQSFKMRNMSHEPNN
jgi:hypothetical protein